VVDCSRCGDFEVDQVVADEVPLPLRDEKQRALTSHLIRKLQQHGRAVLDREFFASLRDRSLPTPAELCDNLLLWLAHQADGHVGGKIGAGKSFSDLDLVATVGAVDGSDVSWAADALRSLVHFPVRNSDGSPNLNYGATILLDGWNRIEELRRAQVASRYAFFARQFGNPDLDALYERCLRDAVAQTGYQLRIVTQKAGHIDAIVEDEIRRCRFVVADLSDDNAGAYWEAGFAEGLGKPVIYICSEKEKDGKTDKKTHFDTDHRQTVRWDLARLDETAARLKAVIRNTLLGDAKQDD
jgi:nucleoside 2-deoxyribosyltransferase